MTPQDYPGIWPKRFPKSLTVPKTTLWHSLEVSAARYPDKPITLFYESRLTYDAFRQQALQLAGFLQQHCGIRKGDRVLLDMQNCPQFMIAYYAILRADAVVVPVSPMNVTAELAHYLADCDATTAIIGSEAYRHARPLMGSLLRQAIVATYSDYLTEATSLDVPDVISAPRVPATEQGVIAWHDAASGDAAPGPACARHDDLCAILYTSGTTGRPKGCLHTHETTMVTAVGGALWEDLGADAVVLATAPLFHVTGMQHSMNAPVFAGATIALLPRWDAGAAGYMIERYRCTHWPNVPTMVVDLLAHPETGGRDLSSLRSVFGGGSSMPQAVAEKLFELCGIEYMEGYGMTETISQTHMNPPGHLRKQCLGIPTFDTESLVVDPVSLQSLGPGERGEIVVRGPQVFKGYWRNPEATAATFADIGGRSFLRTGDLGSFDADGFFYIADRLKRMINTAGYKVWPAEVEMTFYTHPHIREVAIVSAPDARRGEMVKAFVALKPDMPDTVTCDEIIEWARGHLAAYKVPRQIEILDALPRSGSGKILWRTLQEREWLKPS